MSRSKCIGGGALRISIIGMCFLALAFAAPVAQAGWREVVSPAKNWQRIKNGCSYCYNGVKGYCDGKVARAKADQRKMWGIKLAHAQGTIDAGRPLTLLIHGLDSDQGIWSAMTALLRAEGAQVAYFSYPNDGPIGASTKMLSEELAALLKAHPGLKVYVVGHSMGCVVARAYVEGPDYRGEVLRLISIAPPNQGSCWVRGRFAIEWREHYAMWRSNKDWSPIWMFTDGTGEAGDDLRPGSTFLAQLNSQPRRAGVEYTIILGNQHSCSRMTANAFSSIERGLSDKVWGVKSMHAAMGRLVGHYRKQTGDGDGVVTLANGLLEGVKDVVTVTADHNALAMSMKGEKPGAWEVVRERVLGRN